MSGPIVEGVEVSKFFGEVVAVNHLDFEIHEGVMGLLGPNGAGKTTLIRLILGLYTPSRGSIRVFGEDPRNNLETLRRIGYCPELDRFFDNMTGREFVHWLCRYSGMGRAESKKATLKAIEQVKMTERMDDPITTYSQGMRQRIRIAQAISHEPRFLILDEPLSGLDPEGREDMFALIKQLGEEGRTVIVSSHVLYEIERVTNSIILLHNGRMLAHGTVRELRTLIDDHPHAVQIECDDPRVVAEHFSRESSTLSIDVQSDGVSIRTGDPATFYDNLTAFVLAEDVQVHSLHCPDDNLQSVFDYLVK